MPPIPLIPDDVAAATAADAVEVPIFIFVMLAIVILDGSFNDKPLIVMDIENELIYLARIL